MEERPEGDQVTSAASPVVVPRWIQAVTLPLGLLAVYALLRAAGPVTLIFVVAALVALLLNPFVALLQERARFPRGLAVLAVFLALIVIVGGARPRSSRSRSAIRRRSSATRSPASSTTRTRSWRSCSSGSTRTASTSRSRRRARPRSRRSAPASRRAPASSCRSPARRCQIVIEGSIALILIIVLSVYMLLYGQRIGSVVRSVVPRGDGTPGDDYPTRVQRAVFGYVRGQLLFSIIMGTTAGVALWIMGSLGVFPAGKTYALVFGAWFGFAELIPYIGPAIGAAPPVLIALFSGNPLDALWLTIMFTALQQIEGHIVAPAVFSQALRINPLLVIFALLIGGRLYGIAGAFLALPLAAVVRETVVYLREHLVLEPWGTPTAAELGYGPPATAATRARADADVPRMRDAGAEESAYCSACGTELADADEAAAAASAAPS